MLFLSDIILFVSTKRLVLLIIIHITFLGCLQYPFLCLCHITGYSTHFRTLSRYSPSTFCTQVNIRPGKQRCEKNITSRNVMGNNFVKENINFKHMLSNSKLFKPNIEY